jgi:molecular chaperone DnaK
MRTTQAVGIDLGTTYSCIAYLNEHGEPVPLPNQEGELSTPSVVLFDKEEVVVGTEALRNAIISPKHVVQNSKRFIGDMTHRWKIDEKPYTPVDIATFILKKLLSAAQERIGLIEQAVITVPAQFSDSQRHATIEAGHRAGLKRVDIINEPVAAALCYVLGTEGLWFTELAEAQRILVYDLGGGTFDLSLVRYQKNEVSVIASSGDLRLGGIDWNKALQEAIADQFTIEFSSDPRNDPASLQFLALEVEQAKRSLSVRPKAALISQHGGQRKTFQVQQEQFEKLTKSLVEKTAGITKRLLKDCKMGWAHVDAVLTIGGASRMPMIRKRLKEMSGRTPNMSLSPDLSIAHGASYYAGMLLTNDKFAQSILNKSANERLAQIRQQSVNARELGILVRDTKSNTRVPHYLIQTNSPLPVSCVRNFGTVIPNQRRVHLQIIESGTSLDQPFVKLGDCIIDDLPPDLPEESEIAVTIRYDEQAKVHVSAKEVVSGKIASTEIIRQENLLPQLESGQERTTDAKIIHPPATPFRLSTKNSKTTAHSQTIPRKVSEQQISPQPVSQSMPASPPRAVSATEQRNDGSLSVVIAAEDSLEKADRPVPLCNECGSPLDSHRRCRKCGTKSPSQSRSKTSSSPKKSGSQNNRKPSDRNKPRRKQSALKSAVVQTPMSEEQILDVLEQPITHDTASMKSKSTHVSRKQSAPRQAAGPSQQEDLGDVEAGEEEFWNIVD